MIFSNIDGIVKSLSVPLGAGLLGNFVVAAPKGPPSSVLARLASGAFCEAIVPLTIYEGININGIMKSRPTWGDPAPSGPSLKINFY
jgi:hypothetical protein